MLRIKDMMSRCIVAAILALAFQSPALAQISASSNEAILTLMEKIFNEIPDDLAEIDPSVRRVAVYRVNMDNAYIPAPLKQHFESRLIEIFQMVDPPKIVSLPQLSTLRVSSTDSSFSIINSTPSPDELWRVGKRLRVDGFLEGNLTYIPKKALYFDLRLNRTGSNEVLWAKSYKAYEDMDVPKINPVKQSLNAGFEVFQAQIKSGADSLLHGDFGDRLVQYSIYYGIYQFLTPNSRFRYEMRGGVSFLSEGVKFLSPEFKDNAFYGLKAKANSASSPISINFRLMLYSTIFENNSNNAGDWLSGYLAVTRYFTRKMSDLTGIGLGLRSDLSSNFSVSTGLSMVLGSEFDSQPLLSTGEPMRLKVSGLHFEVLLLQYTF